MKAVVLAVSVVLALACFAVATEQTVDPGVSVFSEAGLEHGNAPFVPQAADVDEVDADDEDEVDADDEDENESGDEHSDEEGDEDSDEAEDESEDEADEEDGEFSFLEAAAATKTEASAETAADAQAQTEEHTDAGADARPRPRAPLPNPNKPFKFHTERIEAQGSKNEDPEMGKLNLALAAVKEDILATNKQITDERKWVIAVAKIIASYNDKMKRVEAHIIALRKEMKNLYRKKKQIENLKLQKALEAKLKEARDELATLTSSLKHVQTKQGELNKSGRDLRETIAGIQAQLAKLRGQQLRKPKPAPKKRCKKGLRWNKKAKKCLPAKKKGKKLAKKKL